MKHVTKSEQECVSTDIHLESGLQDKFSNSCFSNRDCGDKNIEEFSENYMKQGKDSSTITKQEPPSVLLRKKTAVHFLHQNLEHTLMTEKEIDDFLLESLDENCSVCYGDA